MAPSRKKNTRPYTQGRLDLALGKYTVGAAAPPGPDSGLDFDLVLRNALARAVKECELSRAQIAAAMTDAMFGDAGETEVTKAQIDSWTAPSRDAWRFPVSHLPAFVRATGAVWLLDLLAERCGCTVVRAEHAALIELGELAAARERIEAREREIHDRLPARLTEQILAKTRAAR